MTTIAVTGIGDDRFGVVIEEGHQRTAHVLEVPAEFTEQPAFAAIDPEVLVRESVGFLLDREPATAIPAEMSVAEIADRYADYLAELRARVGAT